MNPATVKVATVGRGAVDIGALHPADRVVTFDRKGGPAIRRRLGSAARVALADHHGELVRISTDDGHQADVTPCGRMVVRWNARQGWALYLMRRGGQYRIGTAELHMASQKYGFGPAVRARHERAEAFWLLDVFATERQARTVEHATSGAYGITERPWHRPFGRYRMGQPELDEHHEQAALLADPERLLADYGLDVQLPLREAGMVRQFGCRAILDVRACNLQPGWMDVLTDTGGRTAQWSGFTVEHVAHQGPVFGLMLDTHQHYLAGGIVMRDDTQEGQL